MGERRKKPNDDSGERSLIKAASSSSINSHATATAASTGDLERAARKQFQEDVTPSFVYVLAGFSALGGFLFGYDTGVVSGVMLLLKKEMNLSALWQELLVSSTVGAAALSALAGGVLNGFWGRRPCILLASFLFSVGAVMLSVAPSKEILLVGRIVVGLGIGVASMTVPVYIAESAPTHLRGRLVTINTLFITGGQLFASVIDGAFSYLPKDGWRYMLGLSLFPAVLQFFGFLFLPESPRWLIQKGKTQKARRVLSQIRGNQNIDEEYDSIKTSIEDEEKESGGDGPVIWRMLTYPPTRRALIVGCGLQMFQQLSGINTVMYYSATILQMSGVKDDKMAIWLAAVTAFTNFTFTLLGVWLVEKVGRRKLSLGSIAGTALSLFVLAVGFLVSAQHSPPITLHPADPSTPNNTCTTYGFCSDCMLNPDCGFCYLLNGSSVVDSSCDHVNKASTGEAAWGRCSNETAMADGTFWAYNYCPTSYSWTVLMGLVMYLIFFAPGAFFLYSGLAALGFLFIYGCLPETKGKKLEEIESLFENQLCTCGVSDSDEGRHVEYIRVKGSNYHLSDNDASDVE
ncbi:Proton myo-inositol cotransporter [Acipenser ruthenus]|uniref:Proton myo-inositol cotransporter n=1 Tax=Acipenser ruthenus TaxID=7906 RepID=A0A444U8U5_ACIRT|nr:Proton myo-inositol cotransporter [Acipenser ruthenus]